ncbi:hypothetical protein FACS1894151_10560 [Spirochaetia bacterium]|nr:hypothetical protein FACS1894151_10560 [Spirochaetia bacterium]
MKSMKIAVDFDGTCVTHEYPHIGKDIGAVVVLKQLVNMGHKIILNTMRSGLELEAAVNWFKENGIDLYGVNEDPGQKEWTKSPKVFANIYIDDAALGCPLKRPFDAQMLQEIGYSESDIEEMNLSTRPYVNWKEISRYFNKVGIIGCPDPVMKD